MSLDSLKHNPSLQSLVDIAKDFTQEQQELKTQIESSKEQFLTPFVEFLKTKYSPEQVNNLLGDDPQTALELKILMPSTTDIAMKLFEKVAPGVKDMHDTLKSIGGFLGGKSMEDMIDEYVVLWKAQPRDNKKIADWMKEKGIAINTVTAANTQTVTTTPETVSDEPVLEDEEDVKDNDTYDISKFSTGAMSNSMEQYISRLPAFTSVGYLRNPETRVTRCSKTAVDDAKKLYGLDRKRGNAFDMMRDESQPFEYSIISDLYAKKETANTKVNKVCNRQNMGNSEYINSIAGDNNVVDLYVTSSTTNGRKYGHRASMFRIGDQWFVIDPYTALQPGEQKNKPRTLESYTKSMKEGKNKREFMRMNFYNSNKLDHTIAKAKDTTYTKLSQEA